MVAQRRLSVGRNEFRVPGDNRGLRASRKEGRSESDGKQPDDVPGTSGRRVSTNTVCSNANARNSGTGDGSHVASPTRAPARTQNRPAIKAEPWSNAASGGIDRAIPFG